MDENVKSYIPSLEENDVGKFAVIGGELYYLGDDELSKKAAKNQKMEVMEEDVGIEEFTKDVEEKAVVNIIKEDGIEAFNYIDEKGQECRGGIKLVEKNFSNAKNWKIVTESGEDGSIVKTYDDGYYYVPKGTSISGIGKTSYGYIVDYDSDDVIQYEEGTHKYFSYEESVAVTDHLLFSADPGVIDSYFNKPDDFKKEDLGEGIEFYGYNKNGNVDFGQAFTPTSFKFDGKDDYITVECSSEVDKEDIKTRGLTFEFYGVLYADGKLLNKGSSSDPNSGFSGLFSYWSGNNKDQAVFRFGFYKGNRCISWSFMPKGGARNDASLFGPQCFDGANYWNQKTKDDIMEFNRDIYLTIVVNPAETSLISGVTLQGASFSDNLCIKQNIFVGDSKIIDGWYNKGAWDSMVSGNLDSLNKFCLGTCSMGDPDWWFLTHMDCYSLRFYNRALTDDEVKANRKKTIEYHKILESQSKEE